VYQGMEWWADIIYYPRSDSRGDFASVYIRSGEGAEHLSRRRARLDRITHRFLGRP
jgi:hypothetical protein